MINTQVNTNILVNMIPIEELGACYIKDTNYTRSVNNNLIKGIFDNTGTFWSMYHRYTPVGNGKWIKGEKYPIAIRKEKEINEFREFAKRIKLPKAGK